ncbi:MAG: hypothetical protein ACOYO9_12565 [Candidatus Nanopelagicales bacterium]
MITTPLIGQASSVTELEDWGPLAEATGAEMLTSGVTLWSSEGTWEIHETLRKLYVLF